MAALPPNPQAVAIPAQINDPLIPMPAAPQSPPTVNDVIRAVNFHRDVDVSYAQHLADEGCALNDLYNSVLYEHSVVAQAAALAGPQAAAPPWFQGAIEQLRGDIQNDMQQLQNNIRATILPDIKRLMNQGRREGNTVHFEIVPFTNGNDPTLQPHNFPPLRSVDAIQHLNGQSLAAYLTGYGIDPLPVVAGNPDATNRLQKETLKRVIGALRTGP